jgi:hypothetical protein|tara:strand:- start:323 stop:700 length:378 start_codon:yes stop_codon:yes gene_type:complete
LTDLEVYTFIKNQQEELNSSEMKIPDNLTWMHNAILTYFQDSRIKALTNDKITAFVQAIAVLDQDTLGLDLTKKELLHLVNHVPTTGIALGVCMDSQRVEDSETGDALTQEQEDLILELIRQHLL